MLEFMKLVSILSVRKKEQMIDFQAILGEQFIGFDEYDTCGEANYIFVNYETEEFCLDTTKSIKATVNKVASGRIAGTLIEQVTGATQDRFAMKLVFYKSGPKLSALKQALQGFTRIEKERKSRKHATGKLGDLYKITHRDTGISIMAFCNEDRTLYAQSVFIQFFNTNIKHRIKKDTPSELISLVLDELKSTDFDKELVGSDQLCTLKDINHTVRDYNYHSANKAVSVAI